MLEVLSKTDGATTTAFVNGRVDSTNASEFDRLLEEADTTEKLIIDFEKLEYISSAGLRVLLKSRKKHADLSIVNASTDIYDILDMTGFTEMINVKRAYRTVSVDNAEVIGQGANGKVYRIDPDTVVKVYLNPDSLAEIEHEREVARKALVLGIPTAISYDVVKVGDHYASMFEMLNAKSFSKLLAANPAEIDKYVAMYIDLLKLIHSTEVPEGQLPDQREVLLKWIAFLKDYLPADVHSKLTALCEAVPKDNHMIHGDYHTKNIMLQNDEVILIDMDTLAVGHPILELASMYNSYDGYSAVDRSITLNFLGYSSDIALEFWKKSLKLYYNTDDEKLLEYRENQAKVVGLIRVMRRTIRRNGDPKLIEYCKNELIRLSSEIDSLV